MTDERSESWTPEEDSPERTSRDSGPEPDGIDRTGPLSDLAAAVVDREATPEAGPAAGDADPGVEALFDRESVADIDRERLWERLEEGDSSEAVAPTADREIREVEKGSYCHQCEHFAAPPTVGCTREGTDILQLTSFERFRVADCPVVLEDEALEGRE